MRTARMFVSTRRITKRSTNITRLSKKPEQSGVTSARTAVNTGLTPRTMRPRKNTGKLWKKLRIKSHGVIFAKTVRMFVSLPRNMRPRKNITKLFKKPERHGVTSARTAANMGLTPRTLKTRKNTVKLWKKLRENTIGVNGTGMMIPLVLM